MNKQDSLFDSFISPTSVESIAIPNGELRYCPHFLSEQKARAYEAIFKRSIQWEQSDIQLYGKTVKIPRLNAWYGDADSYYHYSGTRFSPKPWTPELLELKQLIEVSTQCIFNSVLMNCYRDGNDSVAWHSDDEPELGKDPIIASLSLGDTRQFQLKHKGDLSLPTKKLALTAGSLLIMSGATQDYWRHQVPKTQKVCGERINLTFRRVFSP